MGPSGPLVVGSGMGRTGTNSLMQAFEKLGFNPCHHMVKCIESNTFPEWKELYDAILDGKEPDFSKVYAGIKAQCDNPGSLVVPQYLKQQLAAGTKIKVVHTIRDSPEKWIQSARDTVFPMTLITFKGYYELRELGWPRRMILFIIRGFAEMNPAMFDVWFGTDLREIVARDGWKPAYKKMEEMIADDALLAKNYEEWTEHIKKVIPKEHLLIFNVKEGWKPLCEFLDLPIPTEPFPNVNDTQSFKRNLSFVSRYVALAKGIAYGVRIGVWGGIGYLAWRAATKLLE